MRQLHESYQHPPRSGYAIPAKHTILATIAVLSAGILSLLPWRLTAQPSSEPPPASDQAPIGRSGGFGMGGLSRGMSARSPTTPPTNVAPARLEATVYEIAVPENHIAAQPRG